MGAKKAGKGKGKTSAGIHSNVASNTLSNMRASRSDVEKFMNKFDAYLAGKNPWLVLTNPNKHETNKPFIRVRAIEHYGNVKNRHAMIMKNV